jgi:hypothetical protein
MALGRAGAPAFEEAAMDWLLAFGFMGVLALITALLVMAFLHAGV